MNASQYLKLEQNLEDYIRSLETADLAHDLSHIKRVVATAKQLGVQEKANLDVIIPAAWLHDCVSLPKDHPKRSQASKMAGKKAVALLRSLQYPEHYFSAIAHAIEAHSFSANIAPETIEAKIVQDADRIDALGAIGIARCIQVSTGFNSALYATDDPFAEVRELNDKAYCIDHFYTKLFKLSATMNTQAGRQEAERRTEYMKGFLRQLGHEIGEAGQ
ncbi:phosphohydrolase [Photobacterium gaetbulicola]|uniref:Phosphohydrolase n=1 Tax=Photobacterium gaetbulicola TaxID=1295392 RepID=A0A0B9GFD9_9GAMM|nr:HD domain-containing protein [Photobacterium gaetbulicola]KHT63485.1 phosphohydrolase [Photobacterium gaetbulicola]